MGITFSIIIPVYNVERYLKECLDSVLDQTFYDFEAICVNDCSTDNSLEILKTYQKRDKRIKIIEHSENKGLSAARNSALDAAQGKYIVCLDSDDWLETDCLDVIYTEFITQKTNSIWFCAYKFNDKTKTRYNKIITTGIKGKYTLTPQNIYNKTDFSWIKAYTTKSIKENNLYWPEGLTFEDGEFYFKYFTLNPVTYFIDKPLYNYRVREGSIVNNAKEGKLQLEDIFQVVKNIRNFYIENNLYSRYKIAILNLLNIRIKSCRNILNNQNKALLLSKEILEEFNFPDDFEDLKITGNNMFSIILPVYNVEEYIEDCIKSILNQSYTNFEILCVDDCGNDNSMNIIEKYAQTDNRIKIIKHDQNKGLGAARNTALNEAQGEYIVCVDSDDWIKEDCLQKIYNKFQETKSNSIWYKADVYWDKQKKMSEMTFFPEWYKQPEGFITLNEDNLTSFPMYAWNKAYKRNFIMKHNIRWSEGVIFEDVEFGVKAGIFSPDIYVIDEALYVYRRNEKSIISTSTREVEKAKDIFIVSKNLYEYLKEENLFEKYKSAFYRHANDNINMYRHIPNIHKQLYPYIKKYIEEINL